MNEVSGSAGVQPPRKDYTFRSPSPEAFMVENAHWDRLRRRVDELEKTPTGSWLISAVFTAASIGVSALLAVLVLPESKGTRLGEGVKPTLWAITAASLVLAAVLLGVYFWMRKARGDRGSDICDEMDTIKSGAWREGD